jgi:hypothetical protein
VFLLSYRRGKFYCFCTTNVVYVDFVEVASLNLHVLILSPISQANSLALCGDCEDKVSTHDLYKHLLGVLYSTFAGP